MQRQAPLNYLRSLPRWNGTGFGIGRTGVLLGLAALFFAMVLGSGITGVFAQSHCSSSDHTYIVVGGDTLSMIAARYGADWRQVASYNHLANPDRIYQGELLCIASRGTNNPPGQNPVKGHGNPFPYGQCTWWASQRYYQLTGIYVPWTTGADAWQWTARAYQFHWRVSSRASRGAIVDLQPWVQGAYGLGHVAVVERVIGDGNVIASSMNWGSNPLQVTRFEFTPASGVTFISF